ncbi:MAG: HNH endonuclease, partial [Nitrospinales bacterium]|nr:HNH endonuclease [Nitrospinales bacterium]
MGNLPQRLLLGLLEWGSPKVIELIKKGWIKTADDLEKLEPEDLLVLKNLRDQKVLSSAKNKVTALPKEKSATEDIVDIFEEDIVQVPIDRSSYNLSRYEKAKARINPADKKLWRAKSLEDKQKHLLEQYELIATGQKTKKEVAEELGYVLHNFSTIEQAAKLKYKKWLETRPKDIFSQEFKIKSTDQSKSKRIDKTTGYVMQVVSPRKKREMLEILENTKKLKPDDYKWGNDEFSLAFTQEYKKFFPDTFDEGLGGSNKFISDRYLAKQILDFQGSNLKLTPLPTTLRYDQSGDIFDITREGIQSSKAAWEQTPIGDITTGLASKYAKTQLLDVDGIWNAAKSSIYRDPMISDFLLPIRKNVAGGFDIDHITPIRFGGTNNKSNLRLIIKGSHLGETLSPDMTSVNAAVKNKSAMENDVFELSKEMINLVVNKEYKKALDIKQAIQT